MFRPIVTTFVILIISFQQSNANSVCYDRLGCFSLDEPWQTKNRPAPAPDPPRIIQTKVFFYARPNTQVRHVIEVWPNIEIRSAPFDHDKFTYVINHGFANSGYSPWMHKLKDALLKRRDGNVMIVDWGNGAGTVNYFAAAGNLRLVARELSNLLQFMIEHKGMNVDKLHLIGHSLGAQICGLVGKSISGIKRITALDPAQPLFEDSDQVTHLVASDARFVDAIHTDARPFIPEFGFGYMNPVGDVDIYINGGHGQPGCDAPRAMQIPNITDVWDFPVLTVSLLIKNLLCPHARAHEVWTESVENIDCMFWGFNATMENLLRGISNTAFRGYFSTFLSISDKCERNSCTVMGLATPTFPGRGTFVTITRGSPPYCIYDDSVVPKKMQTLLKNSAQQVISKLGWV